MGEFIDTGAGESSSGVVRQSTVGRPSSTATPAAAQFDSATTTDHTRTPSRRHETRYSSARSPYYQRYQEPPPPASPTTTARPHSTVTDAYAASVASRVIQPPIVDFRETNGGGGGSTGGGVFPDRNRQTAAAALVASIERCSEPIQNGRALQTDIREIRRIIKAYVGRLQDREVTNQVAKEWRVVARVLDRLFFMLYIGTIVVSLATMFPKG